MVNTCSVSGCTVRFHKDGLYTFHSFPKDENLRKVWEQSIGRQGFISTKNSKVCSRHFEPFCFDTQKTGGTWLKSNAVPSLFGCTGQPVKEEATKSESLFLEEEKEGASKRKRYVYLGDFTEEDLNCPEKCQKVFELAYNFREENRYLKKRNKYIEKKAALYDAIMRELKEKNQISENLRGVLETSETPAKEAKHPTPPVEPTIKIKTEPVDDYPKPSTSKDTDNEEFIIPDKNSSWSTPDSVVEPQFTFSVASLAFPIKSEPLDDETPKKKQRTNSSETETLASALEDTEIKTENHIDDFKDITNPSLSKGNDKDQFDDFGMHVAGKLKNLNPILATCAKNYIEDILVKAEDDKYLNQTPNTHSFNCAR